MRRRERNFLKSTEKKSRIRIRIRISRKRDTGYWQLLHVPQGLPTHIWRRKAWKTRRMMFPILAGYIAMALADRPALMPGIVGGLLAKSGMTMAAEEAGWVSSGFFGALIAGFAAGLIMLGLKKILEKLPKALEGTKLMLLYPFLGIAAMGALMVFVVNPPVGAFNEWLNQVLASMGESSRVLLGAVLGGMVPPIGIALATLFFKNRFTKSEQQTVATNFIMGLSFITEGAIPFAASDPLLFLAAVAAGSVVAMLGIVLLKKPLAAK